MKLALLNTLSDGRGGGISGDGLSLDLQFATDKTLAARKGPTPVFTRASSGTFVGSNGLIQTAATNIPRFDHTAAGVCRGLLMEESRTNIILRSEDFGTTWVTTNTAIGLNTQLSPDGNTTADTATISNAGTNFLAQQVTVSASTQYTFSFYVKRGSATNATYSVYNNNANNDIVPATSYFSQTSSSDWVRVSFQFTTPVGCTSIFVYVLRNTVSTGSMHFWGAQLEVGSFATSYIPTTTASVVRSADVCSISGSAFTGFWNRFAGTMIIGVGSSLGSAPRFVSNLTAARAVEIYGTSNIDFYEASGNQEVRIVTNPIYPNKLGLAYAINDYQSAYNGVLGGSDTNTGGTIPDATQLHIGSLGGVANRLTGHIAAIRYYKKRLPNAKLQALTV